jgi:iron complex transport system ATP-binding protein
LDSDFEIAKDLRIPVVTEIPFAQVSDDAYRENIRRIEESVAVIVSEFAVGPGNLKNLEAASRALDMGKTVIVMNPGGIEARDFVGGKAKQMCSDLLRRGAASAIGETGIFEMLASRSK